MKKSFLGLVIIAMVGGLAAGLFVHSTNSHSGALQWAGYFNQVTSIFLRLIKMIIAPLVLTTLVSGIGHIEKASTVGRIGTKAMIWFVAASFCALVIGLLTVNLLQPGVGANLVHPAETALDAGVGRAQDLTAFFEHLIPASIVDALGKNEILQVVVFSLFAGIAISSLGVHAKNALNLMDEGAAVVLKITTYVMMSSPIAIFAAVAGAISVQGIGILVTYGKLVGDFYLALIVLIGFMIFAASWVLRDQTLGVIRAIWSPALIAFSTSTSEAAFPLLLKSLEGKGFNSKIVSFVLPLGYSFNMTGGTLYCAFAAIFIAQAYGVSVPISQQIIMLLVLMVTSKGIAGVPRASLVVLAATLPYVHLPENGIILILAVDHLMDMGRSAANVIGNGIAAAAVARWESNRCNYSSARVTASI